MNALSISFPEIRNASVRDASGMTRARQSQCRRAATGMGQWSRGAIAASAALAAFVLGNLRELATSPGGVLRAEISPWAPTGKAVWRLQA